MAVDVRIDARCRWARRHASWRTGQFFDVRHPWIVCSGAGVTTAVACRRRGGRWLTLRGVTRAVRFESNRQLYAARLQLRGAGHRRAVAQRFRHGCEEDALSDTVHLTFGMPAGSGCGRHRGCTEHRGPQRSACRRGLGRPRAHACGVGPLLLVCALLSLSAACRPVRKLRAQSEVRVAGQPRGLHVAGPLRGRRRCTTGPKRRATERAGGAQPPPGAAGASARLRRAST